MSLPLISAALLTSTSPLAQDAGVEAVQPALPVMAFTDLDDASEVSPDDQPGQVPTKDIAAVEQNFDTAALPEDGQQQVQDPVDDSTIVVTADSEARKRDPLVKINESTFALTQDVDKAFVEPVADAYKGGLPKPVRRGLRNFFRNLLEPVNFLNYLLQLKPGKAFETLGRFTINSTIGIAGLIDVAKEEPFNLPYRRNGFANTLGYYGVGPGPFLVLPLIGATSLRDVLGSGLDQAVLPIAVGKPFNTPAYAIPAYTVNSLEFRIEFDERLEAINESDDPYFALRETYLCQREAEIAALKNQPPPRDCSLEALFSAGLEEEVTPQAAESVSHEPAASIEITEEPIVEPAPPAIIYKSEPVIQPISGEETDAPSLTLEGGCALLEEGVNTLHVVTC
jgi:phospholipid-binding lipoprotein MlaA